MSQKTDTVMSTLVDMGFEKRRVFGIAREIHSLRKQALISAFGITKI
jgi:hypothetical protein